MEPGWVWLPSIPLGTSTAARRTGGQQADKEKLPTQRWDFNCLLPVTYCSQQRSHLFRGFVHFTCRVPLAVFWCVWRRPGRFGDTSVNTGGDGRTGCAPANDVVEATPPQVIDSDGWPMCLRYPGTLSQLDLYTSHSRAGRFCRRRLKVPSGIFPFCYGFFF